MDSPRKRAALTRRAHCCSRRAERPFTQTGKAARALPESARNRRHHLITPNLASKRRMLLPSAARCAWRRSYIEPILESWKQRETVNKYSRNDGLIGSSVAADANAALEAAGAGKRPRERDAFRRAETEDDDGYDPYSDRPPKPLFQADPLELKNQGAMREPTKSKHQQRTESKSARCSSFSSRHADATIRCPALQTRLPHPKRLPSLWRRTQPLFTFRIAQKKAPIWELSS